MAAYVVACAPVLAPGAQTASAPPAPQSLKASPEAASANSGDAVAAATAAAFEFAFGWRPGMEARVERVNTQRRNGKLTHRVEDAWTLRVKQGPGETLRIDWLDPEVKDAADSANAVALTLRAPFEVTQSGTFRGVAADADAFIANYLGAIRERRLAAKNTAESRAMLASLQAARVSSDWALTVSNWLGAELSLGDEFVVETDTDEVEGVGSARGSLAFSAQEQLACPGVAERTCVRVHLVSRQSPQSVEAMVRALVSKTIKKGEILDIEIDTFQLEGDVVTEPGSLIPYVLDYVKLIEGVVIVSGKRQPIKIESAVQERYVWR